MLTDEDIKKLIQVFATREEIVTGKSFESFQEETRNNFNELRTAIDAYDKKADAYFQEMVMLNHKVDRHEKWFQQVANKLGINLEY